MALWRREEAQTLTKEFLSSACDGVGVGALVNTIAVNVSNIESFRNCTKVNGDLVFIGTSFTG